MFFIVLSFAVILLDLVSFYPDTARPSRCIGMDEWTRGTFTRNTRDKLPQGGDLYRGYPVRMGFIPQAVFQAVFAQTEIPYNYPVRIRRIGLEEEQKLYELFKTIYFPFVLLYDYTGMVGCILIGMGSIFMSLMGITVFEGRLRVIFICLLVYLLGPLVFYVWAYVFPGKLFY